MIFVALLVVVAFAAVPTTGKFNAALPGFGKSSDDRIHKLEMEMVKIRSLQERMTNLEIAVAKKFGQLQGQDGKPLKDEVSDLNSRLDNLEKKVVSAGPAKRTR
jgi:predicted nuclease with TOPRIM domain